MRVVLIHRFKWSDVGALALMLQFICSPLAAVAAPGLQGGDSELASPEPVIALSGVPAQRGLAAFVGKAEISVLADVDGEFVRYLAEHRILEEEAARKIGETDLSGSVSAGRGFSRESLAALSRQEQARARTGQALALLLPSVSVRASYGSETSEPAVNLKDDGSPVAKDTHDRTDTAVTVRQPLFDLPGFLDWRRRKVVEQAFGEDYRVSDGDAYLSSVNAYLALVSSRLQADLTRDFEAQLAELFSYIEKRATAGAASVSDMARVRARIEAALSFRLEQESACAEAGFEFVRLTNLAPEKLRLPEPDDVGAGLLPKSVSQAVTTALQFNPEIAALTAEVQAAKIEQSAARGRFLPRIDAEYTDTYSQHAGGEISADGQRDKRIMMVLNWTPLSGGGDYQYYRESAARGKELLYRLDDQRRRVVKTLSDHYATLNTTRERIATGYQELESISTAAEAMSKRMLSGNQSLLDLLDVYDRSYQARARLVNLHILEMSTAAQLVRLTYGTPGAATERAGVAASGSFSALQR
jgi:adhesin transport system outer membrane protein